jgi:hypothetical protein
MYVKVHEVCWTPSHGKKKHECDCDPCGKQKMTGQLGVAVAETIISNRRGKKAAIRLLDAKNNEEKVIQARRP